MMLAIVLGIYLPTKICAEKFGNVIIYVSRKILIIPDALIVLKSHFDVGVYFFSLQNLCMELEAVCV